MLSKLRDASAVSFFDDVASCQIAPSGACTTPPTPQRDFSTGFTTVAPAATAASNSARTLAGCAVTSDTVYPRNPVLGASVATVRTWESSPNASE